MQRRIIKILLLFVFLTRIFSAIDLIYASSSLDNPSDFIQVNNLSLSNIEHQITFTLPANSSPVNPSDYIIIKMPYFQSISTADLFVTGTFIYGDGTGLHVTISGNNIYLSNLSIIPGATIYINRITATNPSFSSEFNESIDIATDMAESIIKNSATLVAEPYNGKISVSADIQPYTAQITLTGYAYPGFFLTFTENSAVLNTSSPDGSGYFSVLLTGLTPGFHTIMVEGIDATNNVTASSSISIYATPYQNTNYQNLILSPIIFTNTNQVHQSDSFTFTGETVPNSSVTISVNSPLVQYSTTSDSSGNFTYSLASMNAYSPGDYQATATVQTPGSVQSIQSLPQSFTVLSDNTIPSNPKPSCDISKGDLNCDGHVTLIDFSILLYYWGTNSALADINGDGNVDLIDFSIMMYYFGS